MSAKTDRLWGSAFEKAPSKAAVSFAAGRDVTSLRAADYDLIPYDIWVNRAHCAMLYKQNIVSESDAKDIMRGLQEIEKKARRGSFILDPQKEDVHTNIESYLIDKYGIETVGKLHTARSRNDQIVTDMRLYLRARILDFVEGLVLYTDALLNKAAEHSSTVMPGFTHRQHAMVTSFGHLLHSLATMADRDIEKLKNTYAIIDENTLGNAASFGTSFPIDRDLTTEYLGFSRPDRNSIDAITNRWEPEADVAYAITSIMNHLSVMAETLIIMSMSEFSMVTVSHEYSTGSSIMPQKKNPDTLEVIKGKTSLAHGLLVALISTGKAPLAGYNRDSQWTKYVIMDLVRECLPATSVAAGVIDSLTVKEAEMEKWARRGFIGATSLLEIMCATYEVPFRKGKIIVEQAVAYSKQQEHITLAALKKALKEEETEIDITRDQVRQWQDPLHILKNYRSYGSASDTELKKIIRQDKAGNQAHKKWVDSKRAVLKNAKKMLAKECTRIMRSESLHTDPT